LIFNSDFLFSFSFNKGLAATGATDAGFYGQGIYYFHFLFRYLNFQKQ